MYAAAKYPTIGGIDRSKVQSCEGNCKLGNIQTITQLKPIPAKKRSGYQAQADRIILID
jgi:hypothetical protein